MFRKPLRWILSCLFQWNCCHSLNLYSIIYDGAPKYMRMHGVWVCHGWWSVYAGRKLWGLRCFPAHKVWALSIQRWGSDHPARLSEAPVVFRQQSVCSNPVPWRRPTKQVRQEHSRGNGIMVIMAFEYGDNGFLLRCSLKLLSVLQLFDRQIPTKGK